MRIIEQLRKLFPGIWKFSYPVWEHEAGWNVYCCAAYSPRWDCDDGDDAFSTRYYRSDTGEQIFGLTAPCDARIIVQQTTTR